MTARQRVDPVQRDIVSFTPRSARMNAHRQRAWDAHHAQWVLDLPRGPTDASLAPGLRLDPVAIFGRDAPLIVEIGPGGGDSIVPMAARRPDADVLAFEVYRPGVAKTLARLAATGNDADLTVTNVRLTNGRLTNVRLVIADAVAGLAALPDGSVSELWVFFPDPWPKLKHHKRRLVQPPFADLVAGRLGPGGRIRLATDDPHYGAQMRRVLDAHPAFSPAADDGSRGDRPVTKFEQRARIAGRPVTEVCYRRA